MVGANDLGAMVAFYDSVLGTLGLVRDPIQPVDCSAGVIWQRRGQRWPQFALSRPFDGRAATVGNGVQISFAAASRGEVVAAWRTAIGNGGSDEGGPRIRPQFSEDFFAPIVVIPRATNCALFTPMIIGSYVCNRQRGPSRSYS